MERRIAASVTRGAVRCSAWFGVAFASELGAGECGTAGMKLLRGVARKPKCPACKAFGERAAFQTPPSAAPPEAARAWGKAHRTTPTS